MRFVNKVSNECTAYHIPGKFAKNIDQRIRGYLKANKIYRQPTRKIFISARCRLNGVEVSCQKSKRVDTKYFANTLFRYSYIIGCTQNKTLLVPLDPRFRRDWVKINKAVNMMLKVLQL